MKMIAVEAITKDEGTFVHLSSTMDKAIEWIKKHGEDWYDVDYCFIAYTVELDNDEFCESIKDLVYISKDGNTVDSEYNLLFSREEF